MSVDEVWSEIVNKIKNGIDKFVPQRNISGRSVHQRKTVSHTTVLDFFLNKKRKAFKTYKKYRTKENYNAYDIIIYMLQLEIK